MMFFLSFRGEDTRKNFVDHLYHALHQKGIITYKDNVKIKKGERISDQLIRSIEESRLYIIVFSKNYVSSSWCLDELVKIMECQKTKDQTAYPVFFDVEPSEVRHQSGTVGEAFAKHVRGSRSFVQPLDYVCSIVASCCSGSSSPLNLENEDDVGRWRNALKDAASLAGMELKNTFDGHEAKFIQQIVLDISLKLRFINSSVDGKLVGMVTRVKNIVSSLETGIDEVHMIGIKGMGGGGKTTLARAVFDHISIWFDGHSFVENVREVSKGSSSGLKELQKQILKDVSNDQSIDVRSVSDGKILLKKMMSSRKVLVVLDDVNNVEQLEALAGERSWFKPGSRIIITTRDEQVLIAHRANVIHDVSLLSHKEAICLFSRYAFEREIPVEEYKDLSEKIVSYAAGLPLTIKILGSFLCGRIEHDWEDTVERLKRIPLKETLEKLELSYDGLEDDQKEIFLDIACILKKEGKRDAIRILESCGFHSQIGLSVLEQKSLITLYEDDYYDGDYKLVLHDHIEEMGKNIVRRLHPDEPQRHSRLWIKEEIEDILVNELGTKETKYIQLEFTDLHPTIIMKGLRKMKELRLFSVYSKYDHRRWKVDEVNQYLPNTLRSLDWHKYPFCSLPKMFQPNKLIYLKMDYSNMSELWEGGDLKVLNKLKFLDLSNSKLKTLNLRVTPHLETLNLSGCKDFVELHLPVKCPNLKILNLCDSSLGNLHIRMAPNLEILDLVQCKKFVELKFQIECLNLKFLNLSGSKVSKLNLGMTPHLKKLDLVGDGDFVELYIPVQCAKLKSLDLSGSKLSNLNLGMTPNLEKLNLKRCLEFVELHMPIECPKLKDLNLGGSKVSKLNLRMTPHIEMLDLERCNEFVELHMPIECAHLKSLNLIGSKVSNLNLGMTPHLVSLHLRSCYHLQEIHAPVGSLKKLSLLDGYPWFKHFQVDKQQESPGLDFVGTLELRAQSEDICPLHPKANLPTFFLECKCDESGFSWSGYLDMLISSCVCVCTNVEYFIVTICGFEHVKELTIHSNILEVFKELWQLESLEKLSLGQLDSLEEPSLRAVEIRHLPDSICTLKHLKSLKLRGLHFEQLPENIYRLDCLEELQIIKCKSLLDISNNICKMKSLECLNLSYCCQVEKLPEELGHLKCLKKLNITGTAISHLPDSIYELQSLHITGYWEQLQSICFGKLSTLPSGVPHIPVPRRTCMMLDNLDGSGHRYWSWNRKRVSSKFVKWVSSS